MFTQHRGVPLLDSVHHGVNHILTNPVRTNGCLLAWASSSVLKLTYKINFHRRVREVVSSVKGLLCKHKDLGHEKPVTVSSSSSNHVCEVCCEYWMHRFTH